MLHYFSFIIQMYSHFLIIDDYELIFAATARVHGGGGWTGGHTRGHGSAEGGTVVCSGHSGTLQFSGIYHTSDDMLISTASIDYLCRAHLTHTPLVHRIYMHPLHVALACICI